MYAKETTVPVAKTREEIRVMLLRRGADKFGIMEEKVRAFVAFEVEGLPVQIVLPLPNPLDQELTHSPNGRERSIQAAQNAYDQVCRARWRALRLVIQAKLEAVDLGIDTLSNAFLGDIVVANGETVSSRLTPVIHTAVLTGQMPTLLLGSGKAASHG